MTDTPKIAFDVEASLAGFAADLQKAEGMARTAGTKIAKAQSEATAKAQANGSMYFGSQAQMYDASIAQAEASSRAFADQLKKQMEGPVAAEAVKALSDGVAKESAKVSSLDKAGASISKRLVQGAIVGVAVAGVDAIIDAIADEMQKGEASFTAMGVAAGKALASGLEQVPIAGGLGRIFAELQSEYNPLHRAVYGGNPLQDERDFSASRERMMQQQAFASRLEGSVFEATNDTSTVEGRRAAFMRSIQAEQSGAMAAGMGGMEATRLANEAFAKMEDERERREVDRKAKLLDAMNERMNRRMDDAEREYAAKQIQDAQDAEVKAQADAARADAEAAKIDDATWKSQDAERLAARKSMDASALGSYRERLSMLSDEIGMRSRLGPDSFMETRDTAVGSFRFAQADASKQLADNSDELVKLGLQQVRLLDEIKRLQGVQFA